MKTVLAIVMLMLLTACGNGRNVGGSFKECYGVIDSGEIRDNKVAYELETSNIVLSVLFVETVVVPIWLIGFKMYCPVGAK